MWFWNFFSQNFYILFRISFCLFCGPFQDEKEVSGSSLQRKYFGETVRVWGEERLDPLRHKSKRVLLNKYKDNILDV